MRVVLPGVVGTDTSQLCLSGLGPVCNRFYRLDRYAKELRSPAGPRRRRKRTHAIGVHPLPSAVLFVWYLMATQAPAVTATWKAPVSACGPLCAIFREGWHPFPNQHPEAKYAAFVDHVGIRKQSHRCKFHGRLARPRAIAEDEKKSGIKNRRQVWRSVQSLLPAVRAVTRVFGAFQSGVKIEGVISLLRSYSPRAYSRKKIMGVMPDIGADFKGRGEFINHLAPSHPPAHPVPISSEIRIHTRWRYSKIASQ